MGLDGHWGDGLARGAGGRAEGDLLGDSGGREGAIGFVVYSEGV